MKIICEQDKCTGCSLCSDVCRHNAITMRENSDGFIVPIIDLQKCVDCGLCQKMCPVLNPERVSNNNLADLKVYEAWASDTEVRMKSSSGGVFGQLSSDVLKEGGIVFGVAFDGNKAFHAPIAELSELSKVQDTKYVQSYAHGAYLRVYNFLKEGKKVIFSGTPCQVAACKSYLYKKKYTGKLLTIEVVCHGVPSYHALEQSIKYVGAEKVISFRDKGQGWGYHSQHMRYLMPDGNVVCKRRDEDLFYRMFFCKKLLRSSCYSCPFAYLPRVADLTIGDSWGTSNTNKAEIFNGLSLLLVNNENGKRWLRENGHIRFRNTSWLRSLYINRNIYTPFPPAKMIRRITDIHTWISNLDLKKFMEVNSLGFTEHFIKDSFFKKKVRNFNYKMRQKFLDFKDSAELGFTKLLLLKVSYKLDSCLTPKPSERYLDGKFIHVLYKIYKSQK